MNATTRTAFLVIGCPLLGLAILGLVAVANLSAAETSDKEIAALVEQLGDPDYVVRERAQEKLGQLGEKAFDALTVAANDSDLEIAARARHLLLTIELPVLQDSDSESVKEALEGYSDLSTADQLGTVRQLMALPNGEGYRAACRLVHIENSVPMSTFIAATMLNRWPMRAEGQARMGKAVAAELKNSGRKAARWLVSYAQLVSDSKSNLEAWRQLVEEEESLLKQRSLKSGARVVATLLYDLAYWESQNGATELAQNHFDRAQKMKLLPSTQTVYFYVDKASFYRNRGMIDWAAQVYGQVSKLGYAEVIPYAQLGLAEMLHDAGRHQEAAAALDEILKLLDSKKVQNLDYMNHSAEQVKGRKHFFLACRARDDGNDAKYRTELVEAIENDPNELDALIALYRIPDLDKAIRKKTIAMIEAAADRLRQDSEAMPDEASAHNQFAWIVGNTTGDMQEALRHALRAVELTPDSGAYFDTLAHVYFYGLKDYDKAVETQAKAVELMPHSGLIVQKYELFRKAAKGKTTPPSNEDESPGDTP